jgi:beta-lactamase superfamily II metal-dependent hydrolase
MKFIMATWMFVFFMASTWQAGAAENDVMRIHFLNVGQADCLLLQTSGGKNVLIDSGDHRHAGKVLSYLQRNDVDTIDILIATHPHHDHIGAMHELLDELTVHSLYMPALSHRTKTYKRLKEAVAENETTLFQAKAGQTIRLTPTVKIDVLAPLGNKYRDRNDYSLVLRVTHGENVFLLMADAGKKSERELVEEGYDLRADVVKIGHHGAATATTSAFLKKVKPQFAVISAGDRLGSGFPSRKVIGKLERMDVTVYRTDVRGAIVAESDGSVITIYTEGD